MVEAHEIRTTRMMRQFDEAIARFSARLEAAGASAERPREAGWTVAQIAWHVAKVNDSFAGLMTGRISGAEPAPEDFAERDWSDVVAAIPATITARGPSIPPAQVTIADAIERLRASAAEVRRAIATLTPERGGSFVLRTPITGVISVYQIAEWATAHVIRHNAQAKRVLAALNPGP
jgi:hypothetical protein